MESNTSDALQHPPSFDEMVGLIKKLFTDYLEDVMKSTPEEISKSWERYKTLNHLWQDNAQPGPRWVKGTQNFPVRKPVIAKKFISYLNKEVVGVASSATGEMICFDWGGAAVCLAIGHEELNDLYWLDEQPAAVKQIDREWLCDILIEFTIAYVKSANKDIANDAAEYIYDKLKDVGIEYVLSEIEQPAAGREEDAVAFHDWVLENEWEINYREQRTHTTAELYKLFKQQHNP